MPRSKSVDCRVLIVVVVAAFVTATLTLAACAPEEPQPVGRESLPEGTYDPEEWGEVYPEQYEAWRATADPRPEGSRYKRGGEGDPDRQYDKLSEYPFLAPLAKGIGFSVEFNEPRGHASALIDQNEIDPARLGAGGVCLACKSPYYEQLLEDQGEALYSMPYEEATQLIPEQHRALGVTCISCHDPGDTSLVYSDLMSEGLQTIGAEEAPEGQIDNVVCGQCHSTYTIPKNDQGQSVGLFMPWEGGSYGDISVENIIETIESDPANAEFTQTLTGLRLGYIRHPEFELFTRDDVHYRNGVTCVDCHMPYKVRGDAKVSDHNVMSPLDDNMRACRPCHPGQREEDLREAVFHVQDRFVGALLNTGYSAVADAQLIRMVNEAEIGTRSADASATYGEAVDAYKQSFYRVAYLAGENSVGFHNPSEAFRILTDAQAYSQRADAILRRMLAENDIEVPAEVDLQLRTFIEERGERRLGFVPEQEFKDPRGIAEELWQENLRRLRQDGDGASDEESP